MTMTTITSRPKYLITYWNRLAKAMLQAAKTDEPVVVRSGSNFDPTCVVAYENRLIVICEPLRYKEEFWIEPEGEGNYSVMLSGAAVASNLNIHDAVVEMARRVLNASNQMKLSGSMLKSSMDSLKRIRIMMEKDNI